MHHGPYVQEYFDKLIRSASTQNQLRRKYEDLKEDLQRTMDVRRNDLKTALEAAELVNIALEGCDHNSEAYRLARAIVDGTTAAKVSER